MDDKDYQIVYILYAFRDFGGDEEEGKEEARKAERYYNTIVDKPKSVIINKLMNELREKTKSKYQIQYIIQIRKSKTM